MKKRGFTLVEVLTSMFIFTLIFAVCLSTYLISVRLEQRQSEYLFFESVCLDINEYSNAYKKEWNIYYFGNESHVQYYDSAYILVAEEDKYQLSFSYNEINQLIVNVKETNNDRYIIKDLNYGSDRYE